MNWLDSLLRAIGRSLGRVVRHLRRPSGYLLGIVLGVGAVIVVLRLWPPPWTLGIDASSSEWTAFGTMVIALVAVGVGIAEARRSRRERRESFIRQVDSLALDLEDNAFPSGWGHRDQVGSPLVRWSGSVSNYSDRTFRDVRVVVVSSMPVPTDPADPLVDMVSFSESVIHGHLEVEPARLQDEILHRTEGIESFVETIWVGQVPPGEKTRDFRVRFPVRELRLAYLVVPDEFGSAPIVATEKR